MKLPHADEAVVEDAKLYGYLLNPDHLEGGGKAYLFNLLLGINASNGEELRVVLFRAAREGSVGPARPTPYGTKYEVRLPLLGKTKQVVLLSVWQVDAGATAPRLITALIE